MLQTITENQSKNTNNTIDYYKDDYEPQYDESEYSYFYTYTYFYTYSY